MAAASAQQPVTVIGPVTVGNCAVFNSNTVIKDFGTPCGGGGGGGVTGPGSSTVNGLALWSNTGGNQIKDGPGQTIAGNYTWSGTETFNGNITSGGTNSFTAGNTFSGNITSSGSNSFSGSQTYTNFLVGNVTDPVTSDQTNLYGYFLTVNYDNNIQIAPGFSNANGFEVLLNTTHGNYVYGSGTNSKTTFLNVSLAGSHVAQGQRFLMSGTQNCYGKGDCAVYGAMSINHASYPSGGDEGVGFGLVSGLFQYATIFNATASGVSRNTCNTTLTQTVTGSINSQTVTVASGTGCTPGTWVVLNHERATFTPNHEAAQIISSTSGSITAVIAGNYSNGMTVTPAVSLLTNAAFHAEGRVLVDLSATPYTTGTVTGVNTPTDGVFLGSGTGWSSSMLSGGTTLTPGCVTLTADDFSSNPFGPGLATLHDYYQIEVVTDATHLTILTTDIAANQAYKGRGPGSGAYRVLPCAEILRVPSNTNVILDTNSFAWTTSDNLEISIPPYPDVSGFQYHFGTYTSGGTNRAFLDIDNLGARKFQYGIQVRNNSGPISQGAPGADVDAYGVGYFVEGSDIGLQVNNVRSAATAAILLPIGTQGGAANDAGSSIVWGSGGYISPNGATAGLDFRMAVDARSPNGVLSGIVPSVVGSGSAYELKFTGFFAMPELTIGSNLPTCVAGLTGAIANVGNASTNTWGSVPAGTGANHVLIRCNGTSWTVVGI